MSSTVPNAPRSPVYPVGMVIDYPDRPLDRVSSIFRIFAVIPIAIVLCLLASSMPGWQDHPWQTSGGTLSVVFLPSLLMILFQQKYPRWWFEWNVQMAKFAARVGTYLALMNDKYPSTDEEQWVHMDIPYPDVRASLNRWMPLVKWFLAIPHYIVLAFLWLAAFVCAVVAWFAILFTARYPRDLFNFVAGVARWHLRVVSYAFMLVTDRYPPFSLQ